MAADLYSIIPGVQVTKDEILQAEVFWQQYLATTQPDLDTREGTAVRDLVVRPGATLLAVMQKALMYYSDQNSIANIDNNTATDIVDSILSNWFIERAKGSNAVINVRLYFAARKVIYLPSGTTFSPDGALQYSPGTDYTISEAQLNYDVTTDQYYYDVDLISAGTDSKYNLTSGSLLYFTNFDTYFLHAEINYLVTEAVSAESNSQYISRTNSAISTRNLVNIPSIDAKIRAQFPTITSTLSIGMGEPEMLRDYKIIIANDGSAVSTHVGGMTDVYLKGPLAISSSQFTADALGVVTLTGPIYKWERLEVSAGDEDDTMPPEATYTVRSAYHNQWEDYGFSIQQSVLLDFGPANAGKTVSFNLSFFQMIEAVQAFLDADSNRVISADMLARGMNFYSLNVKVESYQGYIPDATLCAKAINAYIAKLSPGQPFVVSDAGSYLNAVGVLSYKTPIDITYTHYKRDLTQTTGTLVDRLDPEDRTCVFILNQVSTGRVGG